MKKLKKKEQEQEKLQTDACKIQVNQSEAIQLLTGKTAEEIKQERIEQNSEKYNNRSTEEIKTSF